MSLIHWWPLNGNTNDYGTNNLNGSLESGTSFNSAGKIGQCLVADDGTYTGHGVDIHSNLLDELANSDYSICAWIKVNGNHRAYEGAIISSGNWNNQCWAFGLNQDNTAINPAGNWYNSDYVSYTFEVGKWYHVVSTQHNDTSKVYVNGTLIGTVSHGHISVSDADYTCIGRETYAGGYFGFNGEINDVRIYNHTLSQKEVKEISKGLVLHYNFEDAYAEGTTNIDVVKDEGPSFAWTELKERVVYQGRECWHYILSGTASGWFGSYSGETGFAEDTILTRSCWLNIPEQQDRTGWYGLPFAFEGMKSVTEKEYDLNKMGTWQHCYSTGVASNTSSNFLIYMLAGSDATFRIEFYMTDIQTEQKDHATPFTNGTRQPGLIYDNSGYGNNGTQVNLGGLVEIVDNTCSGSHSALFDSKSAIDCGMGAMVGPYITVNMFAYFENIWKAHSYSIASCTEGGGWNFNTADIEGKLAFLAYREGYMMPAMSLDDISEGWHMITGVVDETSTKIYLDGVLKDSVDNSATLYYPHSHIFVGTESGGTSAAGYNNFPGNIADFRIYATALSQEDILLEYNRKAAIDRNGKAFTGEFVEKHNNIAELANYAIEKQLPFTGYIAAGTAKKTTYDYNWPNPTQSGLGTYEQGNLLVTLTSDGVRIYSEANRDGRAQEGSEWNTWGGLCYSPMMNSYCLVKGHRYIMYWHVKGQSSRAMSDVYWTNQVGWGQYPDASPTIHKAVLQPENFQGEMDCMYDFTIEDDIWKTTTDDVHSGFEPNTTYLAYAAFKMGYTYDFTGELGTDIYITNLQMIDVTDGKVYKITKNGTIETTQIISGVNDKASIYSSGILNNTNIEEI